MEREKTQNSLSITWLLPRLTARGYGDLRKQFAAFAMDVESGRERVLPAVFMPLAMSGLGPISDRRRKHYDWLLWGP